MRFLISAGFVILLGLTALAAGDTTPPVSTHEIDPVPNAEGWNNTVVTLTITAEDDGSGVKAIHYILNGEEHVVMGDTVQIQLGKDGVYVLEYWATDNADNVEAPHHVIQIKIDRTPPVVFVEAPEDGAKYFLHQPVEANWYTFDTLSGIATTEATRLFGEEILTEDVGFHEFRVKAVDKAGNETVVEVNYQVVYKVVPMGVQNTYLDNPLPPDEREPKGRLLLFARYAHGDLIGISFALKDYFDEVYPNGVPSLTVTEVKFEGTRERHVIWDWLAIPYDPDSGIYRIYYPTAKRKPGIYDLWIGFGDGNHVRLRIEITAGKAEG